MKMNISKHKSRNYNKSYVSGIFYDVPKATGKLVLISNGGYTKGNGTKMLPHFGYRIYWDSKAGQYNCQVISQVRNILFGEYLKQYSVAQCEHTSLDTVENAILYNEYHNRVCILNN